MKIKDINKEGKISLLCLIAKCDLGKNAKGNPYLNLTLQDNSGQLDARFWNLNDEQISKYKTGMIVEAKGDIIFHKNAAQLKVSALNEVEEADLAEFVVSAPMSRPEMEAVVDDLAANIQNDVIRQIVQEIINNRREDYFTYPAAVRNHHSFVGGLAYHTITMAKAARMLLSLYPWLNYDLLIGGILLHDACKVDEYTSAVLPEYTAAGNLIGHISMISNEIDRAAFLLDALDKEEVMLLKHMVLSHHGKLDYGSPVLPMIPEAEALSIIDDLDSRMNMMKAQQDIQLPGTFGPRVFALDNRMVYRPSLEEEKE